MRVKPFKYVGLHKIRNSWKSLIVLVLGLAITVVLTWFTHRYLEAQAMEELASISKEIGLKIDSRLHAHALILRAGAAHFSVSDTVTREEWKDFVDKSRLDLNVPGIQGVGYSVIISPENLEEHIELIRRQGFPNYTVYPQGDREIYTSIIYLEPFSGRNLRAFGYDMFSEPVRRRAMELARDLDIASLTGRVDLVQETGEDVQAGTLMYVARYDPGMPTNTVEERRAAIIGWVYSPYRMRDLMQGILGRFDEQQQDRVRLQIYDDSISVSSLLYDSQKNALSAGDTTKVRSITLPVEFNNTNWLLVFTQTREFFLFNSTVIVVVFSGIIISFLLYLLSLSYLKIRGRSVKIRKQNEELHKLNATKDKFFSIIAHDLKSPFNSIMGFSKILVEQTEKKKYDGAARYAEIIHQSSNMAMDLLTNLMEWSQSHTGRIDFNPEPFDLVELIHEVKLLFVDLAAHKSVEIRDDVSESFMVYADYEMVGTILRNLISNAVKFTHPGGKITISARKDNQANILSVSDNGVGIPRDKIDKLFQIDESYSTKGTQNEKGTGLGLILCREFTEKHGGKIWVESSEKSSGKNKPSGSTFYFSLPFEEVAKKRTAAE